VPFIRKILSAVGKNNRKLISLTILVGFIAVFFEVIGVGAILPLIAIILDRDSLLTFFENNGFGFNFASISNSSLILFVLVVISFVYILKFLVTIVFIQMQATLQKNVQIHVSDNLLNIYTHMSYERYLEYNSSKFLRNMQGEIGLLSNSVLLYMNLFTEILMVIGILSLMLFYDFKSTLFLFFIFLLTGFLYFYLLRAKIHFLGESRFNYAQKRVQVLQDIFNSVKVGIVHDLAQEYVFQYKKNNDQMSLVGSRLKVLTSLPKILFEFLAVSIILSVVYIQVLNSNSSSDEILSTLALFSVAAIRLMPSANKILTSMQGLKSALPGTQELLSELEINTFDAIEIYENPFKNWSMISFINVNYQYPKSSEITLTNINFEINSGEVLGIYGRSGSGKSTLIDLMVGLLEPSYGSILIDGVDIKENYQQWMKCIGYLPQETYLLDSSILHNIVGKDFTLKSIDDDLLTYALRVSGLDKVISKFPQGSMTEVGQGGSSLSGGQKQRVGIARAIYRNPSLLILDEPTSSLDKESKELFRDLLLKYKNKLTFIIISHDQKDMDMCSKIIEVNDGSIQYLTSKNKFI
jgi:ATP-binding cassette, subfamily B, bacterial PglK